MISNFAFIASFLFLVYYIFSLRKAYYHKKASVKKKHEAANTPQARAIQFFFENRTSLPINLNIFELDPNDERYSFSTSFSRYDYFVEYMKTKTLQVISTKVCYYDVDWQKDVISICEYSPFGIRKGVTLFALNDYDVNQVNNQIIESNIKYALNYFTSINIRLEPNQKKSCVFLVADDLGIRELSGVQCAVSIKNTTSELKRVVLFDDAFYKSSEENGVIIQSVFDTNTYSELINFGESGIWCKRIRFFHPTHLNILFNINGLSNVRLFNKMKNSSIFDYELQNATRIRFMEVDVEPNSEMIISLS